LKGRERLLAVLSVHGVTATDYAKVEKARRLIDEVNAALAGRDSALIFAVTMASAPPTSARPPEILE
jgi:hypothetical protein